MCVFRVLVKTGNQEKAGTDANVFVTLEDDAGLSAPPLKLDVLFYDDLERGVLDSYSQPIPETFGRIQCLHIIRDNRGLNDDWFCDYVIVQDPRGKPDSSVPFRKITTPRCPGIVRDSHNGFPVEVYFPVCRWITADHTYSFLEYGVSLPTEDIMAHLRIRDLEAKRASYLFVINMEKGPAQAAILPSDEKFSEEYFWTFMKEKAKLKAKTTFLQWTTKQWKSIDELVRVTKKSLGETQSMTRWQTDEWFGLQRLQGVNPYIISLCKKIPDKLDVTEETISGLLGELSLEEALEQNKIFICDLEILEGVGCKEGRKLAAPMALFYLKSDDELLPIAIQLQQQKGPHNPVFTPMDPHNTWLVAKMFYNNAEAQHHQGVSHLGLTHLLMEGICVCTHRQLSPSHPIFKLMAPHFLFLIAINTRGLEKLISQGGWVDNCMTQGITGIFEVIRRGINRHNFSIYGNIEEEVKSRGVLERRILPYYPYRDDAINLFKAIRRYVSKVVHHYYDTEEKLLNDWELQEWRRELSLDREKGGVGLIGVPGDDVKGFQDIDQVVETVAIIISTCSVAHSAANFQQYEQYGFAPNYPGLLNSDPPTEKKIYTEAEIVALLPDMQTTLDTMVITKLLSSRGTNSLGNFEMQYLYHPDDVQAAEEFRKELKKISLENKKLNIDRKLPFAWLDPEIVPNSISI